MATLKDVLEELSQYGAGPPGNHCARIQEAYLKIKGGLTEAKEVLKTWLQKSEEEVNKWKPSEADLARTVTLEDVEAASGEESRRLHHLRLLGLLRAVDDLL